MFWLKKTDSPETVTAPAPVPETKDDGSHADNSNELNRMENIINDVLSDGKKGSNTLRDKASSRAESLELHKFPVRITGFRNRLFSFSTEWYTNIIYAHERYVLNFFPHSHRRKCHV